MAFLDNGGPIRSVSLLAQRTGVVSKFQEARHRLVLEGAVCASLPLTVLARFGAILSGPFLNYSTIERSEIDRSAEFDRLRIDV